MSIHISPLVLHLRMYGNNVDIDKPLHEMTAPYLYHAIAVIDDMGACKLQGFDGFSGMNSVKIFREMANKLKEYGVKRIEWRHNGKNCFLNIKGNK